MIVVSDNSKSLQVRRFKVLKLLAAALGVILFLQVLNIWGFFAYNSSSSVSGRLFFIVRNRPISRGDLVAFWPPANDFTHKNLWFVKYVQGVPGDMITRDGRRFYINGQLVSEAKSHSFSGQVLHIGQTGRLGAGRYFLGSTHPDGFDSRYAEIGWINEKNFIGRAIRIF